jgi:hypothetical protein
LSIFQDLTPRSGNTIVIIRIAAYLSGKDHKTGKAGRQEGEG